ncbi:uncharacterized protein F4822DRAFT_162302 [Hypoxylon trugodes]|uniref:uncharacterized protein n=1 Tax=Hypoxylon trugodes TaxID=326681 RepID=UPI00219ACCCC|nr:uncharacterized protein F4822DRAFT_162302 [Hypoxylon trugodes]KAI1390730.1 hypothetical protein F4822DRAFT_162302 [Hypoxylon trugodes]
MKASAVISLLAAAGFSAAVPSSNQIRSIGDVLPNLKRDVSGAGFTHVGSDNVVRTFDKNFNVVDFAQLDDRAADGNWPRSPSVDVLNEAKQAKARAEAQVSKPQKPRTPLDDRQEKSCVSENCPNDEFCTGLSVYGYDCSSCLFVTQNIGNCQQ